ncbi:MAG: hypothetical protein ACLR5G_11245 [Eubacteriales bacterium]
MSKEAVKSSKYEIDMTTGAILPKMLRFTLPLMASSMLQSLFNAADIIIVGKSGEMGDYYMGAVGRTARLSTCSSGSSSVCRSGRTSSRRGALGQGRRGLSKTVHTSMMIALVSRSADCRRASSVASVARSDGHAGRAHRVLDHYLMIYFLGMIPTTVYNFGSSPSGR